MQNLIESAPLSVLLREVRDWLCRGCPVNLHEISGAELYPDMAAMRLALALQSLSQSNKRPDLRIGVCFLIYVCGAAPDWTCLLSLGKWSRNYAGKPTNPAPAFGKQHDKQRPAHGNMLSRFLSGME